jgi:hypothetical protein
MSRWYGNKNLLECRLDNAYNSHLEPQERLTRQPQGQTRGPRVTEYRLTAKW